MPSKSRRSATIKDVAEAAGVSVSTVSHAFSGARPISQATKKRVFEASRRLRYVPNAHARKLRLGRSGMLGLSLRPSVDFVSTPDDAETFNRLAGSMATHCLHHGLGLVHVPDIVGRGHDMVPMDGCIVAHPRRNDPAIDFLESAGIPFVLIDPDPGRAATPWTVSLDYVSGVQQILELVSGSGTRPVILINEDEPNAWNLDSARTYSHWCESSGFESRICEIDGAIRGAALEERLAAILESEESGLGIVFMASDTTETLIEVLRRRGWSIPGDASIAALTDTAHSRMSTPTVTAMDLVHEAVSVAAVDMLIARIEGAAAPSTPVLISPQVNQRASTEPS